MKKITYIIIIVFCFVQASFGKNSYQNSNLNNQELIEKLTTDIEFLKLVKLTYLDYLSNSLLLTKQNNLEEITIEDLNAINYVSTQRIKSLNFISHKYKEFETISNDDKIYVFEEAIKLVESLTINETITCLSGALMTGNTCGSIPALEKFGYIACMLFTGTLDLYIILNTGGSSATSQATASLQAKKTICKELAGVQIVVGCSIVSISNAVTCMSNQLGN